MQTNFGEGKSINVGGFLPENPFVSSQKSEVLKEASAINCLYEEREHSNLKPICPLRLSTVNRTRLDTRFIGSYSKPGVYRPVAKAKKAKASLVTDRNYNVCKKSLTRLHLPTSNACWN